MKPSSPPAGTRPAATKTASSTNFDDLWSMSLGSSAAKPAAATAGKSIKDLEKEKAQASIWGGGGAGAAKPAQSQWGAFAGAPASSSSSNAAGGGGDDLLL